MSAASQTLWAEVGDQLDVPAPGGEAGRAPIQQRRRRGFDSQAADGRAAVRLLRGDGEDGLLRWCELHQIRARALAMVGREEGDDG